MLELTAPAAALRAAPRNTGGLDAHVSTPGRDIVGGLDDFAGRDGHALSQPGGRWDTDGGDSPGVLSVPVGGGKEALPFAVAGCPDRLALPEVGRGHGPGQALSQEDRARTVAELQAARTGALPSVRELTEAAEVGRGTAHRALTALRAPTNPRHPNGDGAQAAANDANGAPRQ